jgi:hypothetical protein
MRALSGGKRCDKLRDSFVAAVTVLGTLFVRLGGCRTSRGSTDF